MNWYIGQDIVAIRNHSQKAFKEGDLFTIISISKSKCSKCGSYVVLDIGMNNTSPVGKMVQCAESHGLIRVNEGIWWFSEECFAPLDSLVNISELTEILETTAPFEINQ